MRQLEKCDLRGSRNWVAAVTGKDIRYGFPGNYTYVRRKECGLIFQNPQMQWAELSNKYPHEYYTGWKDKVSYTVMSVLSRLNLARSLPLVVGGNY